MNFDTQRSSESTYDAGFSLNLGPVANDGFIFELPRTGAVPAETGADNDCSATSPGITTTATPAAAQHADGIIPFGDPLTINNAPRVAALAAEHRLPALYLFRLFAINGGLISYGFDVADLFFRAGGYVDRILKGTKPSDLPVEQPTKFELGINIKTAKALGLAVPTSLLLRADEVIE